MTTPVIHGEMRKVSCTIAEMEFAWTMLPMPKAATAVSTAKTTPEPRLVHPALEHVHRSARHERRLAS